MKLNKLIDHSVLGPGKTIEDLKQGIDIAKKFEVASVCCNPDLFEFCIKNLKNTDIIPSTVVDFPHGASSHKLRVKTIQHLLELSYQAIELDVVVQQSVVREQEWDKLFSDLREITNLIHEKNSKIKLIIETCYRSKEDIIKLCQISSELGIDWVKTSTGFGSAGAEIETVKFIREILPEKIQVKASGGIKTRESVLAFSKYCTRVGSSSTSIILAE